MTGDGDLAGRDAWHGAAARCVARLLDERGVTEDWRVVEGPSGLHVWFGGMRVPLDEDVTTEAQLFEELDGWVAWSRPAGPGCWLPRDEAARSGAEQEAARTAPLWRAAAARLGADLEHAWGVTTSWEVTVVEGDLTVPTFALDPPDGDPAGAEGVAGLWVVEVDEAGTGPGATPALVRPGWATVEVTMWTADGSGSVHRPFSDVPDEEHAAVELVELFADDLVEEVWGAWPVCPVHDSGIGPELVDGVATWTCTDGPPARVGGLTREQHGGPPS